MFFSICSGEEAPTVAFFRLTLRYARACRRIALGVALAVVALSESSWVQAADDALPADLRLDPNAQGQRRTIEDTMKVLEQWRDRYVEAQSKCDGLTNACKRPSDCDETERKQKEQEKKQACDEARKRGKDLVIQSFEQLKRLELNGFDAHLKEAREVLKVGAVSLSSRDIAAVQRLRQQAGDEALPFHEILERFTTLGLSPRQIAELQELKQRFEDPEFVKLVKKRAQSSTGGALKDLEASLDEDPEGIINVLLDMDYIKMRQSVEALQELDPSFRHKVSDDTASRLQVVVERAPTPKIAEHVTNEFVNGLLALLTAWSNEGTYIPSWADPNKLGERVERELERCKKNHTCDAVLAIDTTIDSKTNKLTFEGRFHFVSNQASSKASTATPLAEQPARASVALAGSAQEPCGDRDLDFRIAAAVREFMQSARTKASILGNIRSYDQYRTDVRFSRPVACGVSIRDQSDVEKGKLPAVLAERTGLRMKGNCSEEFDKGLRRGMQENEAFIGPLDAENAVPVLELKGSSESVTTCQASLKVDDLLVYHLDASIGDKAALEDAGYSASAFVSDFFRRLRCTNESACPRGPEPTTDVSKEAEPEWNRAIQGVALTGLPWLTDGVDSDFDGAAKVGAITDVLLSLGGSASVLWSLKLRHDFSEREASSLEQANRFRVGGIIALAVVAAARLVTIGGYAGYAGLRGEPEPSSREIVRSHPPAPDLLEARHQHPALVEATATQFEWGIEF